MTETFLHCFERVVAAYGGETAILWGDEAISYRELDRRARAVAASLGRKGSIVPLEMERSPEYVASLLGVWMAGAAFLPIDPAYPEERRRFMIEDSRAYCPTGQAASGEDLAYVIYTSGSTGKPKGVLVPHRGIVNFLAAQIEAFRIGPKSRALPYVSISFDASISEVGTALLSGATLCLEPPARTRAIDDLLRILEERKITHVCLTPSVLARLDPARAPKSLETVITGGEVCPPAVVRAWSERVRLINVYGPTEATVCTSLSVCTPSWSRALIGRPMPGVELRVLDGELFIGGVGLALGYLGRPELTAQKFLEHRGTRLYRTGDRVRMLEDGEIEFLGRVDRQVKLRGLLIELEEIERRLLEHADVRAAAVVKRPIHGESEGLVAFVETTARAPALRRHLAETLPAWMLPERFVFLPALPLTANEKIDHAALIALELPARRSEPAPPRTREEQILAEIWSDVLGIGTPGVEDDLFELGGDSFAALEIAARAEKRGLALTPSLLVRHPTIAGALAHARPERELDDDAVDAALLDREAKLELRFHARRARGSAILITGATGFLGGHLAKLLAHRRPICLVRHPSPQLEGLRQLQGDLTAPRFGLDEREWERLAEEVGTIYHAAARVNLLEPYSRLAPANVAGTREVLRLAAAGAAKSVHYASTLSVFVATDKNRGRLFEHDRLDGTGTVYGGYAQTKWVAERLVQRAIDAGLTGSSIHRFGLICGGRQDFLSLFVRGLASIGAAPKTHEALALDITPVEYAARAMVHLSEREIHPTPPIYHLANRRALPLEDLLEAIDTHVHLDRLSPEDWLTRAAERLGGAEAATVLALCRCFAADAGAFERQRTLDLFQATGVKFDTAHADQGLAGSGIRCPPPDRALIERYVEAALEKGSP